MKRGRPLTFDPETIELIRTLALRGTRAREIAKLVNRHYKAVWQLMKRFDIPRPGGHWKFPSGDSNPSWRGGRYIDDDGYVYALAKGHPFARGKGYVREHRLVMEEHLRRYLTETEVVHHKDGNPGNNSLSNLELFESNGRHLKHELSGKVPKWTESGRARILASARRPRPKKHG